MAGNSKDVVIKFVGQNLVGGPARAAIHDLKEVGREAKKAFGGAVGGFAGGLLGGSVVGAVGSFTPTLVRDAVAGLTKQLAISERLARSFGMVTEQTIELAATMQAAVKSIRDATQQTVMAALAPSAQARAGLFPGIPSGFPVSMLGGRQSMFASALQGIREQRAALERQKGFPIGAMQGKFFEQELNRIEGDRSFMGTLNKWGGHLAEFIGQPNFARDAEQAEVRRARRAAQIRARDELERRNARFGAAQDELTRRERQLEAFGIAEAGLLGLGGRFRAAGAGFAGIGGSIAGAFGKTFGAAFGGAVDAFSANRAMRVATESPAETLRRQIGNLQGMQGITPQNRQRMMRQLFMQGIGALQANPFNPLSATESRTLTRGPDQRPVDELKRILHQDSMNEQAELRKILEELKRRGGIDVVLR